MTPLLLLALLLPFPAFAEGSERLLLTPPPGWTSSPVPPAKGLSTTRLFPPGQTEEHWSQALIVQIYADAEISTSTYLDKVVKSARESCEAAGLGQTPETEVNGYPTGSVTITCTKGRQSGMGSFILIQAIRGREAFYVIQRQWRGKSFARDERPRVPPGMLQEWGEFQKSISLCDARESAHPCPK